MCASRRCRRIAGCLPCSLTKQVVRTTRNPEWSDTGAAKRCCNANDCGGSFLRRSAPLIGAKIANEKKRGDATTQRKQCGQQQSKYERTTHPMTFPKTCNNSVNDRPLNPSTNGFPKAYREYKKRSRECILIVAPFARRTTPATTRAQKSHPPQAAPHGGAPPLQRQLRRRACHR